MFIGIFGYLTALEYTSATDAALLSPLQPVFAVILGIVVGLEQASVQRVGGVLLCTVGSMTVTVFAGQEDEESAPQPLLGMAMLMACAVANATMFLAQKKLLKIYPSTTITAWYYLAAGLLTALIASREAMVDPASFAEPFATPMVIVALLYAICFATVAFSPAVSSSGRALSTAILTK